MHESGILVRVLELMKCDMPTDKLLGGMVDILAQWSGFEAVGLRFREGNDFPYFKTKGMSREFVRLENSLCPRACTREGGASRDAEGDVSLDCACGCVLQGRVDHAESFVTSYGSMWTNSNTELLAEKPALKDAIRGECLRAGYETSALIPVRFGDQTFGLLQFEDKRPGLLDDELLQLLESVAMSLAIALSQREYARRLLQENELLEKRVEKRTRELEREVAEHALAEASLRDNEKRFHYFFENAPLPYQSLDEKGFFLDVNKQWLETLGYTKEEVVGRWFGDFLDDGFSEVFDRNFPLFKHRCMIDGVEFNMLTKDKRTISVSFNGRVQLDGCGNFLRTHCIFADVTERKQTEAALKRSEEFNRKIIEATPDCIKILDDNENVVFFSERGLQLLKLEDADGIIGGSYSKFWEGSDRQECLAAIQAARRGETGRFTGYCPDANGMPMWWDVIITTLDESTNRRFLVISRDITLRIQAERETERAKDFAVTANKAKSEFLANMSHEIRTPLNGVLGMLQLLQVTDLDGEQKEYIQVAIRSSKRLTRLLSDILDLSRIEAGKMTFQESRFELKNLEEAVLDLFAMTARNKDLDLQFDLDERLPGILVGDEVRVRQILINLVGNAIKFTREGGVRVEVFGLSSLLDDRYRVLFIVRDTGVGIPDTRLESILEPFVQGEGSYVRSHQGAGLGLSIVARLLKLLGGGMAVDSESGQGTSIYVSIPFKLPLMRTEKPAQKIPRAPDQDHPELRILLTEDDAVTGIIVARMLEKAGHHVRVAVDGSEALRALEEDSFDLIFMDIQMPVMDGVEATRAIRFQDRFEAVREIPIIAMTAYAMSGDKEKFLAAGMDDYVAKPVDREELMRAVAEVMARRRVRDGACGAA
jgi:PAS domain S-box-containing protein